MKFGEALHALQDNAESGISAVIRRQSWNPDVEIGLATPRMGGSMTAPYLYVDSRNGRIPWIPNMVEMCVYDDWEVLV